MKVSLFFLASIGLLGACKKEAEQPTLPKADFTSPTEAEQYTPFSLQNQSQHATQYSWEFDTQYGSEEENPSVRYTKPGTYTIRLVALEGTRSDTARKTVVITPYDIFSRVPLNFAGNYACKVIRVTSPPFQQGLKIREPDELITITKDGSALKWGSIQLFYTPFYSATPEKPDEKGAYVFLHYKRQPLPLQTYYASFFTAGDSARFALVTTVGHGTEERIYYGIRQP
ncbi:PKD domain-containing protein [Hymenobacter sp. J193]|uniref:PKD domain-containing protein n=1 Tax=Hymenobacter sp. J193 TaxID=2898429 RepID=UPI002151A57D|nr:PKD domain-containing protein [Hymenobacter sp. J193]MCR5886830.1 PKD domain-containing protein [Hymenobacter sp. J193]